jgi:hypothetical protein
MMPISLLSKKTEERDVPLTDFIIMTSYTRLLYVLRHLHAFLRFTYHVIRSRIVLPGEPGIVTE